MTAIVHVLIGSQNWSGATLPAVTQALVRYGPQITGTLVSEQAFLTRAAQREVPAMAGPDPAAWLEPLRQQIEGRQGGSATLEGSDLFQQVTHVLRKVADNHPPLLVLDWERLPARVEGVIEEQVRRLAPDLRRILSVASVEGEDFTAQVVAQVQGMEEGPLLYRLAQELEARHRLVREQAEVPASAGRLSRYRFSHALVQNYLYQQLGRGERRVLHAKVAAALGHRDEAVSLLRADLENARATGERIWLWHIHASLGSVYRAANCEAEAEHEFSTARELVEELAGTVPGEALKGCFLQRACRTLGYSLPSKYGDITVQ